MTIPYSAPLRDFDLADGASVDEIVRDLPTLTESDVRAVKGPQALHVQHGSPYRRWTSHRSLPSNTYSRGLDNGVQIRLIRTRRGTAGGCVFWWVQR
jgi:hypothetical protein